jgi:hypothetical protein
MDFSGLESAGFTKWASCSKRPMATRVSIVSAAKSEAPGPVSSYRNSAFRDVGGVEPTRRATPSPMGGAARLRYRQRPAPGPGRRRVTVARTLSANSQHPSPTKCVPRSAL